MLYQRFLNMLTPDVIVWSIYLAGSITSYFMCRRYQKVHMKDYYHQGRHKQIPYYRTYKAIFTRFIAAISSWIYVIVRLVAVVFDYIIEWDWDREGPKYL